MGSANTSSVLLCRPPKTGKLIIKTDITDITDITVGLRKRNVALRSGVRILDELEPLEFEPKLSQTFNHCELTCSFLLHS